MKKIILVVFILCFGIEISAQNYSFIPADLTSIPSSEFQKPKQPIDLVYLEDGTKIAFAEAIKLVASQRAIPTLFVDKSGAYKALVISKNIQIEYPGIPDHLKNLGYGYGNSDSDIVLIHSQGSPNLILSTWLFEKNAARLSKTVGDHFWVNVKQNQMINLDEFKNTQLSFDETKEYVTKSSKILREIVSFFKSQNKKVYLLGASGGAFQITDMIAIYGNIADGYLIMTARLDMNDEIWKPRARGEIWHFNKDGKTIYKADPPTSILEKNINLLQAAGAYKRYTEELEEVDLSNVIYLYGKTDDKVGSLQEYEIEFLKSHGALVIDSNGGHSSAKKYREVLIRLMLLN
ncbi:MAG: hypothetical protein OEM04_08605 [Flavobacteriaceae bacterium]|nr:hypothetical protein [Flavobacteriaceae bacterium]